jgi:predicted metal-binding membrane protein
MIEAADHRLIHLSPAAARLGDALARPKILAVVCVIALSGLGWLYLGVMVADAPGVFGALCRPLFALAATKLGVADTFLVLAMWCAMTLAMMLPSAGPMILTYAEIADTAARKGDRVVSPFVLAAGYTAVWFGFAIAATAAHWLLTRAALIDSTMASVSTLFSGAIFIAAGFYQFSALKHACLRQCQSPMSFFFVNWATTPRGVFRLGLRQGVYCLGCCWAMMLVMFAVGVMNVLWMAALGAVMAIEKLTTTPRFTRAVGIVLIAIGAVFVISSVAGHWPARSA